MESFFWIRRLSGNCHLIYEITLNYKNIIVIIIRKIMEINIYKRIFIVEGLEA